MTEGEKEEGSRLRLRNFLYDPLSLPLPCHVDRSTRPLFPVVLNRTEPLIGEEVVLGEGRRNVHTPTPFPFRPIEYPSFNKTSLALRKFGRESRSIVVRIVSGDHGEETQFVTRKIVCRDPPSCIPVIVEL